MHFTQVWNINFPIKSFHSNIHCTWPLTPWKEGNSWSTSLCGRELRSGPSCSSCGKWFQLMDGDQWVNSIKETPKKKAKKKNKKKWKKEERIGRLITPGLQCSGHEDWLGSKGGWERIAQAQEPNEFPVRLITQEIQNPICASLSNFLRKGRSACCLVLGGALKYKYYILNF